MQNCDLVFVVFFESPCNLSAGEDILVHKLTLHNVCSLLYRKAVNFSERTVARLLRLCMDGKTWIQSVDSTVSTVRV